MWYLHVHLWIDRCGSFEYTLHLPPSWKSHHFAHFSGSFGKISGSRTTACGFLRNKNGDSSGKTNKWSTLRGRLKKGILQKKNNTILKSNDDWVGIFIPNEFARIDFVHFNQQRTLIIGLHFAIGTKILGSYVKPYVSRGWTQLKEH